MPMQDSLEIDQLDVVLTNLTASGVDLFVLASIDDCVPCALMKPIVRHLALKLAVPLCVIEPQTAAGFIERYDIQRFPELIFIRNGAVSQRRVGYDGFDDLSDCMHRAVDGSDECGGTAEDITFRSKIDEAQAEVDAMMAPASAALEPFMAAAIAELQAIDTRFRQLTNAGEMTAHEATRLRRMEQVRIYAPFQNRIDTLRDVQAKAMQIYEHKTDEIVRAFAASSRGPGSTISCSPDGSICSIVAIQPDEPAR